MIPQSELRIGNQVLFKGKITKVTKTHFSTENKNGVFLNFSPITISGEVLLRCGCEYFSGAGEYKLSGYSIKPSTSNPLVFIVEPKYWSVELKSLHQFQNIVYSLSGKEAFYI